MKAPGDRKTLRAGFCLTPVGSRGEAVVNVPPDGLHALWSGRRHTVLLLTNLGCFGYDAGRECLMDGNHSL